MWFSYASYWEHLVLWAPTSSNQTVLRRHLNVQFGDDDDDDNEVGDDVDSDTGSKG